MVTASACVYNYSIIVSSIYSLSSLAGGAACTKLSALALLYLCVQLQMMVKRHDFMKQGI